MGDYKKAFLFNGIGSKMEKLVANMPPFLMEKFNDYRADTFRKMNLNIDFDSCTPLEQILNRWITSAVCDRVIFEYYIEKGIKPDICAGYSSGMWSVCACLGVVPFDFSYKVFFENIKTAVLLQEAGISLDMGTIIGLDADTTQEIIDGLALQDSVMIGSVNSLICVMISGYKTAVEQVLEKALAEGALKAIQMNLPIAFHNTFVQPYCNDFMAFCDNQEFVDSAIPVVSSFDQRIIIKGAELRCENQFNMTKQMRWDLTIKKMQDLGVTEFYDVSASCDVKKFSKWDKKKSKFFTYLDV